MSGRGGQRETSVSTIALVDDDPVARGLLRAWTTALDFNVEEFSSGREAIAEAGRALVVCLDLGLHDMSGVDVLKHLRANDADATIIVVTGDSSLTTAVDVMRAGAYDFLTKDVDRSRFGIVLRRAVERASLVAKLRDMAKGELSLDGAIVGDSAAIRELHQQIENVRDSDVAVCVRGESGSGKELVARAIHSRGKRARGPFVAVNCASIPQSLQESELFGHEKGAFTGAAATHRGRFEQAQGGTLFLDEIGEMSTPTQASLLRALQEKVIRRVGGTQDIPFNARIVCATHRDLEADVGLGRFRQDLYFRLVVYPITSPPLRERRSDIPLLLSHMLRSLRDDVGRDVSRIAPEALEALSRWDWPGNVRELQNIVHRAMLACRGDEIALADLPPALRSAVLPAIPVAANERGAPAEDDLLGPPGMVRSLRDIERSAIARAMVIAGGSVQKAATMLGLGRATLYRRLAELQLPIDGGEESGA